jgi:hypothetical protein
VTVENLSESTVRIYDFVVNQKGDPDQFGTPPLLSTWREVTFTKKSSRSRAFVLALAMKKPRNITNGVAIDVSEALSIYNQKEFHHIYPRAHLKKHEPEEEPNAIANICMLAASENKIISDQNPNAYLPHCIDQLGPEAEDIFASNLLPSPRSFDYRTTGYAEFLEARCPVLAQLVSDLCQGKVV